MPSINQLASFRLGSYRCSANAAYAELARAVLETYARTEAFRPAVERYVLVSGLPSLGSWTGFMCLIVSPDSQESPEMKLYFQDLDVLPSSCRSGEQDLEIPGTA